jgi:hypothetical protein
MNRLAVHQSLVHPATPIELIDLLAATGWDSIGMHIGAVPETAPWWTGGAGERMLRATIDRLLESRITVLDVGRVPLDSPLPGDDVHGAHGRVLEFGSRLGAQFVTARFRDLHGDPATDRQRAERFGQLVDQARVYRLRPLLSAVPFDRPDLLDHAVKIVSSSGGGLVLDVSPASGDAEVVSAAVTDYSEYIGYVRVDPAELERQADAAAGLLAVLPPQVPVVVGGEGRLGWVGDDRRRRLAHLRSLLDRMLEHPRARARREAESGNADQHR